MVVQWEVGTGELDRLDGGERLRSWVGLAVMEEWWPGGHQLPLGS